MKLKLFLCGVFGGMAVWGNAQTLYVPNGTGGIGTSPNEHVGIGTYTPAYKLHIVAGHSDSRILLHSIGGGDDARQADLLLWASEPGWTWSGAGIGNNVVNNYSNGMAITRINNARGGSYLRLLDNSLTLNIVSPSGIDKTAFLINGNGDIGIGTTSPSANLHIGKQEALANSAGQSTRLALQPYGHTGGPWNFICRDIPGVAFLDIYYGGGQTMTINSSGNVGIGTTNPKNLLDVNGIIHAREVKVDLIGWADFVFTPTYKLRPLCEVEQFIKTNGHLPEIPKAEEVQQNGVNLGEMQTKLLQKVEELTLYSIEQEKKLNELEELKAKFEMQEKQINEQVKENAELKQEINELKKLIIKKRN